MLVMLPLRVQLVDGQIVISDRSDTVNATMRTMSATMLRLETGNTTTINTTSSGANDFGIQTVKPIWACPVADAELIHEVVGGVNTLKDRNGTVLWTNAEEAASPDLLLQSTEEGEATLTGRDGMPLWAGTLPLPLESKRSSAGSNDSYQFDGYGVHISGINGAFTIADEEKRVLWSGTLPKRPVILIRRGTNFSFTTNRRSSSGSDRTTTIHFAVGSGEAVIADTKGDVIGSLPIEFLQTFETWTLPNKSAAEVPLQKAIPYIGVPRFTVKTGDGITVTYKDNTGKVISHGTWRK